MNKSSRSWFGSFNFGSGFPLPVPSRIKEFVFYSFIHNITMTQNCILYLHKKRHPHPHRGVQSNGVITKAIKHSARHPTQFQ